MFHVTSKIMEHLFLFAIVPIYQEWPIVFGNKVCTASKLQRQFATWHPFTHLPVASPSSQQPWNIFMVVFNILGGPNGLLPLAHQNRAVTESFGKAQKFPAETFL